jgi:methionyl-tRNA synthetase
MNVSRLGNAYLTDAKLDNALFEADRVRCGTILAVAVNLVYHLASLLHPFMPGTSDDMLKQLHAPVRPPARMRSYCSSRSS